MRTLTCVSASVLALAGAATADFVDVQFTGAGAGHMVNIVSPGHTGPAFAGQIYLTLSNSTGVNLDGNWISYCVDLAQTVNDANVPYEVLPIAALPLSGPMGAVKAAAIYDLYYAANGAQYTADNDYACAFQLAMWEIVSDYTGGGPMALGTMGTGLFQADLGSVPPAVAAILNFLLGSIGIGSNSNLLYGLGNEEWQDQIIEVVPGPGVLAVGAFGALLTGRRRRN